MLHNITLYITRTMQSMNSRCYRLFEDFITKFENLFSNKICMYAGSVSPEYFMTAEEKSHSNGPCGWLGHSGGDIPTKAITLNFKITDDKVMINLIRSILEENFIEYNVKEIFIRSESSIIYEPYTEQIFNIIKKYNDKICIDDLIYTKNICCGEKYCNSLFAKENTNNIYDKNNSTIEFEIPYCEKNKLNILYNEFNKSKVN